MPLWTNVWESVIMVFFLGSVIFLLRRKEYRKLSTLIAGALYGLQAEFLNVFFIRGEYEYSREFIFQIGTYPYNIPIAIGLAWGLLLWTSHEIADCYEFPILIRSLFEAFFVLSVDLFLDVVAVRLEGGFWRWHRGTLDLSITDFTLFGVPWGNFYGWFFLVFFMSLSLHLIDKRQTNDKFVPLTIKVILSIVITEICLFAFLIAAISVDYIPWIIFFFFAIQYFGSIIVIVIYSIKNKISAIHRLENPIPLLYYLFFYCFCISAMIFLQLTIEIPFWFILNIIYTVTVTIYLIRLSKSK